MRRAAHDLRSLLTVIIGYSDRLLKAETPSPTWRTDVENILAAARKCDQVIGGMFTRAVAAGDEGQFDLNDILRELALLLDSGMLNTDIALTLALAPDPSMVRCDPLAMFRAFLNLCMNARHAIVRARCGSRGETAGRLTLATWRAGHKVITQVSDNGCGMPQAQAERMLRSEAAMQGEHGHGLQIVRSTIEKCGGEIFVESEEGQGAIFTIFLPASTGTVGA